MTPNKPGKRNISNIKEIRVKKEKDWFQSLLVFGLIAAAIYLIFGFIDQQMDLNTLAKQQQEVQAEIVKETKELESLREVLQQSDSPEYIEKQAREKLGMVKPDETVYIDLKKQENE